MNYRLFSMSLILLVCGCATTQQMDAIETAADQQLFQGLDSNTRFSLTFPGTHSGAYEAVDHLNFTLDNGTSKQKNVSAVLVKPRKTGRWEVLTILVKENGQWVNLLKTNTK